MAGPSSIDSSTPLLYSGRVNRKAFEVSLAAYVEAVADLQGIFGIAPWTLLADRCCSLLRTPRHSKGILGR